MADRDLQKSTFFHGVGGTLERSPPIGKRDRPLGHRFCPGDVPKMLHIRLSHVHLPWPGRPEAPPNPQKQSITSLSTIVDREVQNNQRGPSSRQPGPGG